MKIITYFFQFAIILLYVFSLFFLGSMKFLGPLTVRNTVMLIVLISAILSNPGYYVGTVKSKGVKGYYVWLVWYIIANIISGFLFQGNVLKDLVTYHFVSLILLYAIPRLLTTQLRIKLFFVAVAVCYFANGVISIGQFTKNPIAWLIGQTINPISEFAQEQLDYYGAQGDTLLSHAIVSGLTGFSVTNGYFIACFIPLLTYKLWNKYSTVISRLIVYVLLAFAIFLAYCVQQRMTLLVVSVYIFIALYYSSNKHLRLFVIIAVVSTLFYIVYDSNFNPEKFGRLFMSEDGHRSQTYEYLLLFLSDPYMVILGNNTTEGAVNNEMVLTLGHNSFLNALRVGGIFSLFIYIYLFFQLIKECYAAFTVSIKINAMQASLAIACVLYLVYSMTHTDGIPSGGVYFWLLYACMHQAMIINSSGSEIQTVNGANRFEKR